MGELKKREQQILDFMKAEIQSKGYPPTVREICTALNIKSTSTTHKAISNLVNKGLLKKDPAKPRAYVVVPQESNTSEYTSSNTNYDSNINVEESTLRIPIIGQISAGTPITADENVEDTFPVPASYVSGNCFMLRVKGESMINVGIMDGDLILVQQQNTARNGDIVVAMIDGFESEATVKTFYKENDHIRLQPENDTMSPIIVKDVAIQGKVKGVFRYFS